MNHDATDTDLAFDADAALAADPEFLALCDERRDAAIEAQDALAVAE